MLGSEELSDQDAADIRSVEATAQVDLKQGIIDELEGLSEKDLLAEQGRPHRDLIPRFEEYATTLLHTYAKCRIPKIPKLERAGSVEQRPVSLDGLRRGAKILVELPADASSPLRLLIVPVEVF